MVDQFAIIVHSNSMRPGRAVRPAVFDPEWWGQLAPLRASALTGISSPFGRAEGHLIILNHDAHQLRHLSTGKLLKRTIRAGKKASRLGARIIGFGQPVLNALGGSVVAVARRLEPTVTSGAGCAAAAAIDGIGKAAGLMGINLEEASVLVLGAAEPLGSACTQILARDGVNYLTLVDSDSASLGRLSRRVLYDCGVACKVSVQISRAVAQADLIIVAGGAVAPDLHPSEIMPGAVVCNLSAVDELTLSIINCRPDVMIFDQSILRLPGEVVLNYDLGLPEASIPASMAEAVLLALESRFDRYFLGRELRVEKVVEMRNLARRHGFKLSGFSALNRHFDFAEVKAMKINRPAC